MRPIRTALGAALLLAVLAAASNSAPALAAPAAAAASVAHGLARADMDTSVAPCENFFLYADGGWIRRTAMPAAYSRYGGFEELEARNLAHEHELLDDAVAQRKAGANLRLLATFYGTCMDSATAEREGVAPIQPQLDRIAALGSVAKLAPEAARLHSEGVNALFFLTGMPDPGNSSLVIATANQGGLGLPNRDYYFKTDSASVRIRLEYLAHVARSLELLGTAPDEAQRQAQAVLELESALARGSLTPVQLRDPRANYHKMPLADLERRCPAFDWAAYLAGCRLSGVSEVNVRQPGFFATLDSLLQAVPLADWQSYLRWHVVERAAPLLSTPFVSEDFRFQQVLTGAKELLPRWRRCLDATDRSLGEALGREYVARYVPRETKARALVMVQDLKAALRDRITQLAWMSEPTKQQALRKLDAMGIKIGYPDKWRDYSALKLVPGGFLQNQVRATRFERAYRLAKIGKPVDRSEFSMTPPTVNARYSPPLNDILFPAGILQPPFFDPEADDAVNYGAIGTVIGHEMTHGFDDNGRQFDAEGNLKDWWTEEDAKLYKARTDRVAAQYNAYTVLDTVHVNGRLTLGENLSDIGGLAVSYSALQKALARKPAPTIDGLSPEQRFFLAYARIWRQVVRPEESRRRIATDSHSPGVWRVNGPLSNMPEFKAAFGCQDGQPMVRPAEQQTAIW
jgi:predicted metalloendopeptidase